MEKQLIIIAIASLLICIGLSGCIIPTYEDEEGTHLGFPEKHESNYDEKPIINILELEEQIHNLINNERQNHGLSPLIYDSDLADIARDHSLDMSLRGYFSHYNPEGQGPTERAKAAGYDCYKDFGSYYTDGIAENIFQNNLYSGITYYDGVPVYDWNLQSEIASSTVIGWMESPGHRQNILDASYDKEGIGVAISSNDDVYITQDFW
jgi:uncharacterized protein YkwD